MLKELSYISILALALTCTSCTSADGSQPSIEEIPVSVTAKMCNTGTLDDLALQVKIMKRLTSEEYKKLHFCICKGVVVLIGNLSEDLKNDAINRVTRVEGVRKVFYEQASIAIGSTAPDDNGTALTLSIKEKMTRSFDINAANFTVTSVGKISYIVGMITSAKEKEAVLKIVRAETRADAVKLFLIETYNK